MPHLRGDEHAGRQCGLGGTSHATGDQPDARRAARIAALIYGDETTSQVATLVEKCVNVKAIDGCRAQRLSAGT